MSSLNMEGEVLILSSGKDLRWNKVFWNSCPANPLLPHEKLNPGRTQGCKISNLRNLTPDLRGETDSYRKCATLNSKQPFNNTDNTRTLKSFSHLHVCTAPREQKWFSFIDFKAPSLNITVTYVSSSAFIWKASSNQSNNLCVNSLTSCCGEKKGQLVDIWSY